MKPSSATNITIDDFKMAFEATEHLIQNGCQRIAHFAGSQKTSIYRDRLNGYLSALENHGLNKNDAIIIESRLKPTDGKRMAMELLEMSPRPDGVFSANDLAAISAIQVFHEHDIQIPSDIAIMGFSNEPLGAYTNPPLSSVNQNPYLMGKTAIESLLDQIENKAMSDEKIEIISEMIIRKSSATKS
ncbi:substrate-binding domain-containing protein [Reichenbachiella agarivorans]|uniref:Substrate-binding domain-containing protein n=1 Tax=Reichenbachiella agarivorans TaxID=2979464 RepID=A0ABY6CTJ3_9BACT|nr:substrate-binding domain-containing protein [Reichenbachiella agarivorans]